MVILSIHNTCKKIDTIHYLRHCVSKAWQFVHYSKKTHHQQHGSKRDKYVGAKKEKTF